MRDKKTGAEEEFLTFNRKWCLRLPHYCPGGAEELPTACQLLRLLAVLYQTSFRTEEGRYPKVAVMWLTRDAKPEGLNVLEFEHCKKLNECGSIRPHDDLLKTVSVCESETIFLLVEPSKMENLDLVAWGIADIRGYAGSGGDTIKEKLDISQYPDGVLTVHFARPGMFSIRHNGEFKVRYPNPDDVDLVGLWCLGGPFSVSLDSEGESRRGKSHGKLAEAIVYFVELVIGRLATSGRGGTLLWHGSKGSKYLDRGTCVSNVQLVTERICKMFKNEEDIQVEAPYRLRELAQWMSEVISVDGATEVASKNLQIIRYGTKISTKPDYMKEVERKCCPKTYKWLKSRGTRHASAAYWVVAEGSHCQFLRKEEPPMALVVSADGEANAIFWKNGWVHRRPIKYRQL